MLLTFIQILHTLVTYLNFTALFYIIYMHLKGRKSGRLLRLAYGLILFECIVVIASGMTCPVRLWVDRYYSRYTPDQIILNNIAPYYLAAGSTLLGIAILSYFVPGKKAWKLKLSQ